MRVSLAVGLQGSLQTKLETNYTAQHGTKRDHRLRNSEPDHTLKYRVGQVSMRIIELQSRCAVIRTVGSNRTLSANSFGCRHVQQRRNANALHGSIAGLGGSARLRS